MEDTTLVIILAVAVVVVAIVLILARRRRSKALKAKFGAEYDRTLDDVGAKRKAEAELSQRAKRVKTFDIHPLPPGAAESFRRTWTATQARFVDDPQGAILEADTLLGHLMTARGYPVTDFDQRAADLSVDHGGLVRNYRIAHEVALRHGRGEAGTEDLRQAMIHYRALFEDLIDEPVDHASRRREVAGAAHGEERPMP